VTNSKKSAGREARGNSGLRVHRTWMPVTDSWIGSADDRLWQRSEDDSFGWSTPDPWTHRIQPRLTRKGATV
jgi:hypothetical protein